jgi:hypothetical protein
MTMGHQRNKGGNQKFLEFNKNESTTYQNLWDSVKAALRRKFITMNVSIKHTETSQIKGDSFLNSDKLSPHFSMEW